MSTDKVKTVYIMVGASGSGKSTYCKKNGLVSVSADNFFLDKDGNYVFNRDDLGKAHQKCLRDFVDLCQKSITHIAVDNTNTSSVDISPYYNLAKAFGYEVTFVFTKAPMEVCAQRNVHKVPKSTVERMGYMLSRLNLPNYWSYQKIEVNTHEGVD